MSPIAQNNNNYTESSQNPRAQQDDLQLSTKVNDGVRVVLSSHWDAYPKRVPIPPEPEDNPFEICNVKLRKVLIFFSTLFVGLRITILACYFCIALNTRCVLNHFGWEDLAQNVVAVNIIRGFATLLWIRESVYIQTIFLMLLLGTANKKYDLLKAFLVFTTIHESSVFVGHICLFLELGSPILSFHIPVSIPVFIFIFWMTLTYMKELKKRQIRERNLEIGCVKFCKNGMRTKDLFERGLIIPKPVCQNERDHFQI